MHDVQQALAILRHRTTGSLTRAWLVFKAWFAAQRLPGILVLDAANFGMLIVSSQIFNRVQQMTRTYNAIIATRPVDEVTDGCLSGESPRSKQ